MGIEIRPGYGGVGKTLRIDGETYRIIGVASQRLEAMDARVNYIVPLSWQPQAETPQGAMVLGRRCWRG